MNKIFYKCHIILIFIQNFFLKLIVLFLFKQSKNQVKNLILFRTGGLGDFIFSLPAISLIHSKYKNKLYFMTFWPSSGEHYEKLRAKDLDDLPWLDFLDQDRFDQIFVLRNLTLHHINEMKKNLKLLQIDGLILMTHPGEPFISILKKLMIMRLLGIKNAKVSGWKQRYSINLFRKYHQEWGYLDHKIMGPIRSVYSFFNINNYEDNDISYPTIDIDLKIKAKIDTFILENKINKYIVICPGSIHEFKEWGENNYKNLLIKILSSDNQIKVLIAGPKLDFPLGQTLTFDNRVLNICGKFNLFELCEIFRMAECVFANDGGAAHLAALANAKLVSFSNGAEEPGIVTPIGNNITELRNNIECSPCFNYTKCPLNHSKCVKEISVEKAYKVFKSI